MVAFAVAVAAAAVVVLVLGAGGGRGGGGPFSTCTLQAHKVWVASLAAAEGFTPRVS